jgi:ParB-like chromosome segregation protein Spo0J
MQFKTLNIASLEAAPWRLSNEKSCRETENVVASLKQRGQLRPILVRPLGNDRYQIIEGHVVVGAAREAGLQQLDCVVREADEQEALLIYLHLKLNRTVENHVKIRQAFRKALDLGADIGKLESATCWPRDRIVDYLHTRDRDETWMKFGYVPDDDGTDEMPVY